MDKKLILSVFLGIFSAGFAVMLLIMLGHQIFPIELPFDPEALPKDELKKRFEEFAMNLPLANFLTVIFAQGVGLLIGLVVGQLIDSRARTNLFAIAIIMLMMSVINFVSRPHPGWFLAADLGFSALLAGGYIYTRKKA